MALIHSPPESCQSKLEILIFILVGCLGYSNSAMNPILYAFLSDNFKKSFMKAFTCAKTKDVNAQLHAENSFFPRFGRSRNSECTTSKATTNLIINNAHATKTNKLELPPAKFGTTVESIVDVSKNGAKNGHNVTQQKLVVSSSTNMNNVDNYGEDESDDEERELQIHQPDNPICIINPSNGTSKPPVLHTDL